MIYSAHFWRSLFLIPAVIDISMSKQLFAANQNKPADIVSIFVANKSKMLRLLDEFKIDKGKWGNLLNS